MKKEISIHQSHVKKKKAMLENKTCGIIDLRDMG